MKYKHLNYQKRYQILAFWKAGYTQRSIAKEIGVHKSRISRELNYNITFIHTKLGSWQYKPDYAQGNAHQRHKEKNKFIKFTDEAKSFVREKLQQNWSLDQISGYANKRYGSPKRQEPIKNRCFIDDRPVIVDEKRESVIGKLIP